MLTYCSPNNCLFGIKIAVYSVGLVHSQSLAINTKGSPMTTITICQWCEIAPAITSVVVKGYEHATHEICADCVHVIALVECATCDNIANFMQNSPIGISFGMCFECDEN